MANAYLRFGLECWFLVDVLVEFEASRTIPMAKQASGIAIRCTDADRPPRSSPQVFQVGIGACLPISRCGDDLLHSTIPVMLPMGGIWLCYSQKEFKLFVRHLIDGEIGPVAFAFSGIGGGSQHGLDRKTDL